MKIWRKNQKFVVYLLAVLLNSSFRQISWRAATGLRQYHFINRSIYARCGGAASSCICAVGGVVEATAPQESYEIVS